MKESKNGKKWTNVVLILILLVDLFMIALWVLSSLGLSPISNYPPFLQIAGFLMVLAGVGISLVENNIKT